MKIKQFEINAFSKEGKIFSGSPAAVCLLDNFLSDDVMQSIASQNNLAETAFIVPEGKNYRIRWFAPTQEVNLCGHATLAAAFMLFKYVKIPDQKIIFHSLSGPLEAAEVEDRIELNFPARPFEKVTPPTALTESIPFKPVEVLGSDDYIVILENQKQIETLKPNLEKLSQLDRRGVVFSAPGDTVDFVSRVFHPKLGISEDPACGSAHCDLSPYWKKRLSKNTFHSYQISYRPAEFFCRVDQDRVFLQGYCTVYSVGEIFIENE